MQPAARDVQHARRLGDVAVAVVEGSQDKALFGFFERHARLEGINGLPVGQAQVGGVDEDARGQHHGALDGVFQLAHVAGPGVGA